MKYLLIAVAVFMQATALAEMPRRCFTLTYFGTCERVQIAAWGGFYRINWEGVDAIRTFNNVD